MDRQRRKPSPAGNVPAKKQQIEAAPLDAALKAENPFVTFAEWSGEADEKAYADL